MLQSISLFTQLAYLFFQIAVAFVDSISGITRQSFVLLTEAVVGVLTTYCPIL